MTCNGTSPNMYDLISSIQETKVHHCWTNHFNHSRVWFWSYKTNKLDNWTIKQPTNQQTYQPTKISQSSKQLPRQNQGTKQLTNLYGR